MGVWMERGKDKHTAHILHRSVPQTRTKTRRTRHKPAESRRNRRSSVCLCSCERLTFKESISVSTAEDQMDNPSFPHPLLPPHTDTHTPSFHPSICPCVCTHTHSHTRPLYAAVRADSVLNSKDRSPTLLEDLSHTLSLLSPGTAPGSVIPGDTEGESRGQSARYSQV